MHLTDFPDQEHENCDRDVEHIEHPAECKTRDAARTAVHCDRNTGQLVANEAEQRQQDDAADDECNECPPCRARF